LSATSGQTVTVNFATAASTATSPADYTAASGSLTFAPGMTTQTITITVQGDLLDEPDETYFVDLSGAVNATIADNQGLGAISDDDASPSLAINDVTVTEGNAGPVNAVFTVTLSAASGQTVSVNFASANNTAVAPSDYISASSSLTFTPGVTTSTITVTVQGDLLDEINETFFVNLSGAVNATIADNQGLGTITDDDTAGITVTPTGGLTTTESGGTSSFSIVLDTQPTASVTITLTSGDGSEGIVGPTSLVFNSLNWNISQTVTITGVDDILADGDIGYTIIVNPASSTDVAYNGFNPADVAVTNRDNDLLVVNVTGDAVDANTADGLCQTATLGECSLRAAIEQANATVGANTINFGIPGTITHTITLASALPQIIGATIIDATTDDSWAANGNAPAIVLDGNDIAASGLDLSSTADGSTIRGLVIRNFGLYGINIGDGSDNNTILGNYIGRLTPSGADAGAGLGNGFYGILVYGDHNNLIGGVTAGAGNVIAGNGSSGIYFLGAFGSATVYGNLIGTNAAGTAALANGANGISVDNGSNNITIGGGSAGQGNLISGNTGDGVWIGGTSSNVVVQGNAIGSNLARTATIGNSGRGVRVNDTASSVTVGGTLAGQGNLIWGNFRGVEVGGGGQTTRVMGNSIQGNATLGIDLGGAGVTPNDADDSDTGPNNLQNYPVLTAATTDGSQLTISGTLTSTLSTTFRLEFFANVTADPTGYGEGQRYLGAYTATTSAGGVVNFNTTLTVTVATTETVSATATDPGGNTSEFSTVVTPTLAFVVNVTTDAPDANTGDGLCQTATPGQCSLRAAIQQANATAGVNTILFNIPGAGPHTIAPTSALPAITGPVTIDGYSQPGASANTLAIGNDAVLKIELNGAGAGAGVDGLNFGAGSDGSTLRGLVINRFADDGISGIANNVTIAGNYIGTNTAGTADLGNGGNGINADGDNWTIGGLTTAGRNLVSGNNDNGIQLFGDGHTVLGNYVGTNAAGSAAIGNSDEGIEMASNSSGNTIGGTAAGAGNVASGNGDNGILIYDSQGNTVLGNYAGVNAAGTAAIGNGNDGIEVNANSLGNTIGGTAAGAGNVASGNGDNGLYVGGGSANTLIVGNYIGVAATGVTALGNGSEGLYVNDASDTVIGGLQPGAGNVIGANGQEGIWIINGATGTVVQGNWIGTDKTGTINLGNAVGGIRIGNFFNPANGNLIGGTAPGAGNVIAFNTQVGVGVDQNANGPSVNNAILGNSIYANTGLGIDLDDSHSTPASAGVTANDANDADTGGNNRQNFPVLTSASTNGSQITIGGALTTTASTQFRLEFFANVTADPSGYGEGQRYLGAYTVTTNAVGVTPFNTTLTATVATTETVTATATDPNNNTSEFGPNVAVTAPLVVNSTGDAGDASAGNGVCATAGGVCTLRAALQESNALAGVQVIHFNLLLTDTNHVYYRNNGAAGFSAAVATTLNDAAITDFDADYLAGTARSWYRISLSGADLNVTQAVIIDGSTQPGYDAARGPIIELNAAGVSSGDPNGLTLTTGGSTVRGLVINRAGDDAIEIDVGAGGSTIVGNYLGTDVSGLLTTYGNGYGITVKTDGNVIGGTSPVDRNVIAGNSTLADSFGIGFYQDADNNIVQGNYIGVGANGTTAMSNRDGVIFAAGQTADNNHIGGTALGAGNLIAGNSLNGITALSGTGNAFIGNNIYSNGLLGINLGTAGVTANDGAKTGGQPNLLMDYPMFTSAVINGSTLMVSGYIGTASGDTDFANSRVELFESDNDASGYGEGQTYLGYLTADASGNFSGSLTVSGVVAGDRVTGTATDTSNNTSEFGPNYTVSLINYHETQTGATTNTASVASASLIGVTNHLYLAAISTQSNAVTVTNVSGLGLTWSLLRAQCSGGATPTRVEVWRAIGAPTGSGAVTANLSASTSAVIAVSRYSNVNTVSPLGPPVSANSNGVNGACSGGVASNTYTTNLTTTTANAWAYGAVAIGNRTHTEGGSYSERADLRNGSTVVGVAAEDRLVTSASTVPVNGTLSGNIQWAVVAVEIRPAP
jgi:CSLREA domain-containing protein